MASIAKTVTPRLADPLADNVSLLRLYLLRAAYLLLVIGLGATIVPGLFGHEAAARGVIPSLLAALWLLAFIGLKHPLAMLPLLMFEFTWKAIWMLAYGLPQWSSGQLPPTFAEDAFAIGLGVILMPIVIPWHYVWQRYVKAPADRWR